ncbi:MAG: SusC/RagA family TonB-linked outer membrane protein [Bacteroidales bacterium]|nr:SusC/RagA family TonB-linked outer membrane protein [Bacteroidales bacterium]
MKCKRDNYSRHLFLRLLFTFSFAILTFSTLLAQRQSDKITVTFKDIPLTEALEKIQKASSYTFFYDANTIDLNQRVSLDAKSLEVAVALGEMLKNTGIWFELNNRQILLAPASWYSKATGEIITVKGTVTEKETGERLSGVIVNIKGEKTYATTNDSGVYEIRTPANRTLVFTFLGKVTIEIPVLGRTSIPIMMESDQVTLEQVIVTGYQTISADRATGSYGSVTSSSISNKPLANLSSALEGQVAGLVLDNEGRLEIRGISTFNAGKSPLIVVDGFPVEASLHDGELFQNKDGVLEGINPNNIQSITVLKDAVAASIYGARAANGVIVVMTNKGVQGETRVSYKGTFSVNSQPRTKDLLIADVNDLIDVQMELYNELPIYYMPSFYPTINAPYYQWMADNGQMSQTEASAEIEKLRGNNFLKEVDDHLFRSQMTNQHNLQISGGGDNHLYNIAANLTNTREDFRNAGNNKLTIDMRNDWNFSKRVSLSVSMNVNYSTYKSPILNPKYGSDLLNFGEFSRFTPYTSFVDENGNPVSFPGVVSFIQNQYSFVPGLKNMDYNLIENLNKETYNTQDFQTRLSGFLRVNIVEGLIAEIGGNWQRGNYVRRQLYSEDSFYARKWYNNGTSIINYTDHVIPEGGILNEIRNNNQTWTASAQLNFNRDFSNGKHKLSALAGFEVRQMTYDNNTLPTRVGYNSTAGTFSPFDIKGWNAGDYSGTLVNFAAIVYDNFSPTEGGISYMDNRFSSYYGNASYKFNNKYILSGSVRLDLTNFFGTDKKYRYKPLWSVGGTWMLSDESFFNVGFIDKLHLRGSYGINGNIALNQGPFLIIGPIDTNGGLFSAYSNYTGGIQYRILSPPNDQLRWEKTASTNAGLDISMFKNRVQMSLDYYYKNSTDLLAPDNIDPTTGYTSLTINTGRIVNKGVELSADIEILRKTPLKWSLTHVFSYNNNIVKSYNVARPAAYNYTYLEGIPVTGYSAFGLWGPRFAKLDDECQAYAYNKDGEEVIMNNITAEDVVYLGQTRPKFDLALTNKFTFGDWDFSFLFVSKLGYKHRADGFFGTNYSNRHIAERWKEPGDNTIYPKATYYGMTTGYMRYADVFVKSSNFLRLREVNLGYNLSPKFTQNIGIKSARLYVQGRNLFLVTAKETDTDPEVPYTGFSLPRELHAGLQITF